MGTSEHHWIPKPGIVLLTGLLVLWGHFIYQVHYQWGSASYYNFGWFVPLLTLVLLFNRLESRDCPPLPEPRKSGMDGFMLLLLLALIPFKILSEVNVFWRVPLFLHATGVLGVTLLWINRQYGFRMMTWLLFPFLFSLTMLPWPFRIEVQVIQWFSRQVTEFTTTVLQGMGLEAYTAGSTIRLGELVVGVDDACSGIRSLQSLLMVALFLGDFFLLRLPGRLGLIVGGIVFAFFFNSIRSTLLALGYFLVGEEFYEFWHDPLGLITFAASFLGLYLLTTLFQSKKPREEISNSLRPPSSFTAKIKELARPIQKRTAWGVCLLALGSVLTTELWFVLRSPEAENAKVLQWTWEPAPTHFISLEELEISDRISDTLKFDYATRMRGMTKDLLRVEAYYYGYTGKNRINSVSSYGHSPLICMQAVGAELAEIKSPYTYSRDVIAFPLQHYVFQYPAREGSGQLHAFWTVLERNNRGIEARSLESLNYAKQFQQAFLGRRDYSRKVLLIAISGTTNQDSIRNTLETILLDWITPLEDSES